MKMTHTPHPRFKEDLPAMSVNNNFAAVGATKELWRNLSFAYNYHYSLVCRQSKGMDRYNPWRGLVQTDTYKALWNSLCGDQIKPERDLIESGVNHPRVSMFIMRMHTGSPLRLLLVHTVCTEKRCNLLTGSGDAKTSGMSTWAKSSYKSFRIW